MTDFQSSFCEGLLAPSRPAPHGLSGPKGTPAGRRYDVYRNNVTVSLIEALGTAFPLVLKLVGQQRFSQLAPLYVRAHPPRSPLMMHYGTEFTKFLSEYEPLSHLRYLADVARLELALREAYHARDAETLDVGTLQNDPENAVLTLAPSTRIVRSVWPLYGIWRYNTQSDAPQPGPLAQDVLITRPEFDPVPYALPPGGADWLDHLASGLPLGRAAQATLKDNADFDLTTAMTVALSAQAFSAPNLKE